MMRIPPAFPSLATTGAQRGNWIFIQGQAEQLNQSAQQQNALSFVHSKLEPTVAKAIISKMAFFSEMASQLLRCFRNTAKKKKKGIMCTRKTKLGSRNRWQGTHGTGSYLWHYHQYELWSHFVATGLSRPSQTHKVTQKTEQLPQRFRWLFSQPFVCECIFDSKSWLFPL